MKKIIFILGFLITRICFAPINYYEIFNNISKVLKENSSTGSTGSGDSAQVNTNTANISTNRANINSNIGNINTNTINISNNTKAIKNNSNAIVTNTTNIANNESDISDNATDIINNSNAIINMANNDVEVKNNSNAIVTNTTNIANNVSDITNNQENISNNFQSSAFSDYQIDLLKKHIKDVYGMWEFRGVYNDLNPGADLEAIRFVSYRYIESYVDGEPTWIATTLGSDIIASYNGLDWFVTDAHTFGGSRINAVTLGRKGTTAGVRWVSVGNSGKTSTSVDGLSWSEVVITSGAESLYAIGFGYDDAVDGGTGEIYGAGGTEIFVAGGAGGAIYITDDTTTWTAVKWDGTAASNDIYSIQHGLDLDSGENLWIAVGANTVFARSKDGYNWKLIDVSDAMGTDTLNCVKYTNNTWYVCSSQGRIYASIDGYNWITVFDTTDYGFTARLQMIEQGSDVLLAVGAIRRSDDSDWDGFALKSFDGIEWTPINTRKSFTSVDNSFIGSIIYAIAYGDNFWVGVGEHEKIASGYLYLYD